MNIEAMREAYPHAQFFNKSCEDMSEIKDFSIALTITSPPYWNVIDYELHTNDPAANYRQLGTQNNQASYNEWLNMLIDVFKQVYRVTLNGGFCAVVLGTILDN